MWGMKWEELKIGFLGFGHMAETLFLSMPKMEAFFHRRDEGKAREIERKWGIKHLKLPELVQTVDLLVVCVRPFQLGDVIGHLKGTKRLISILAGVEIQKISLPGTEVIRAMPNLGAEVREGMTLLAYGQSASNEFRSLARELFLHVGKVQEIEERFMHLSIGLSGSGIAFAISAIEEMVRIAEKEGFSKEKALEQVAQAFVGAGKLVLKGKKPENLLIQIATPGGTTEAGLRAFSKGRIGDAVSAAARRSEEICKSFC
jgi:pyrroline-5-carboxylate reductase